MVNSESASRRLNGRITTYRTPLLPQNSVRAAFQDRRNYLWFGTEEGVVRFDGTEWKSFRIREGLISNFVQCIAEDRFGCLWIGTRVGGMSRFDPHHASDAWRSFGVDAGLPDVDVRAIVAAPDGVMWVATRAGLARLEPDTFRFTTHDATAAVAEDLSAVVAGAGGRIWIGSRRHGLALFHSETSRWHSYDLPSQSVTSLVEDRSGGLWIGTSESGVFRLDIESGRVSGFSSADGLPDDRVLSLLCDRSGDL